jgi:hypothetical protein
MTTKADFKPRSPLQLALKAAGWTLAAVARKNRKHPRTWRFVKYVVDGERASRPMMKQIDYCLAHPKKSRAAA